MRSGGELAASEEEGGHSDSDSLKQTPACCRGRILRAAIALVVALVGESTGTGCRLSTSLSVKIVSLVLCHVDSLS